MRLRAASKSVTMREGECVRRAAAPEVGREAPEPETLV